MTREYRAGDLVVIPPHIPHLFHFVNRTVMAEWWERPFEARYYIPYRTVVEHQLRAARRRDGAQRDRPAVPLEATAFRGGHPRSAPPRRARAHRRLRQRLGLVRQPAA